MTHQAHIYSKKTTAPNSATPYEPVGAFSIQTTKCNHRQGLHLTSQHSGSCLAQRLLAPCLCSRRTACAECCSLGLQVPLCPLKEFIGNRPYRTGTAETHEPGISFEAKIQHLASPGWQKMGASPWPLVCRPVCARGQDFHSGAALLYGRCGAQNHSLFLARTRTFSSLEFSIPTQRLWSSYDSL